MPRRSFHLDVRDFVGFVHRQGNLGGEGQFQIAERAVEGTRGHRRLQKSRGADYEAEIPLLHEVEREGVQLVIGGRVDGIMPLDPVLVEEIKTVDSRWNGLPDPVHFAQLRAYAAILARQRNWTHAQLQLTYLDYETDQTTPFREVMSREALDAFLEQTVSEWFGWLLAEADRLEQRDKSLVSLAFPFERPRKGQIELSRSIYRCLRDKKRLLLEAPTGLGKTMAALFPAAKALPMLEDGKIFYVTAKTPARQVAEEAVGKLQTAGAFIRGLNLTAKGKICFTENPAGCDMRTCPYALGYYDRIKPALRELLQNPLINRNAVEEVARKHLVCPFELSLDASNWSDVVIGDFNYVFDPGVRLQRHFGEAAAKHVVLVDEAHNLVDRSREMYSGELSLSDLNLDKSAEGGKGAASAKRALAKAREALASFLEEAGSLETLLAPRAYHEGALALKEAPAELVETLKKCSNRMESFLAQQEPGKDLSAWLAPFFAMQGFIHCADNYSAGTFTLCDRQNGRVKLFCADPRERLGETLKGLRAVVFFSATLSPLDYFRDLLGADLTDTCYRFASPFSPDQMNMGIAGRDLSYKGRKESLAQVSRDIRDHLKEEPGNHLIFCPSREYLLEMEKELVNSGLTVLSQSSSMNEEERDSFLANFAPGRHLTALAVVGGIFSEGVDLPGERLVGVTVIGVGLPRLSLERDLLQKHFQETRGAGYDYAYLFPGMQRVIQAVGRLIRTEEDRGRALLIDRRFNEPRYRSLFPPWWKLKGADNP